MAQHEIEIPYQIAEILERLREKLGESIGSAKKKGRFPTGKQVADSVFGNSSSFGETKSFGQIEVNCIPGEPDGCHELLLVFCSGGDILGNRLDEAIRLVAKCRSKAVLIISDKWNSSTWILKNAQFHGVPVFLILMSDRTLTPMPLI